MKLDPYLMLPMKVNLKWIKALNIKPEIIKLLEENIGKKLINTGLGNNNFEHDGKNINNKRKILMNGTISCSKASAQQKE